MALKKTFRDKENSEVEVGRDLTESELIAICGGTGGSFNLPNWLASSSQGKSAKVNVNEHKAAAEAAAVQANAMGSKFIGSFSALTALTGGLLGSVI